MDVKIKLFVECKKDGRAWVAICPAIDVASQSRTKMGALASLSEAVGLWFESCISRGVLDQALQDSGFKRSEIGHIPEGAVNVVATHSVEKSELGECKPMEFRVAKGNSFVEGFIPSMITGDRKYQYATI